MGCSWLDSQQEEPGAHPAPTAEVYQIGVGMPTIINVN